MIIILIIAQNLNFMIPWDIMRLMAKLFAIGHSNCSFYLLLMLNNLTNKSQFGISRNL